MEVIQAIRKLLFLGDCVIIPGLGGFISQYRPALIDRATGTFIPPTKEILFNTELVQNDGSLVSFVAENNGISIHAARQQVDLFVKEARHTLEQKQPVYIDGIGQFIQDKGRELRFQADAGTNLFLDSFGLASFRMREVVHENQFKPSVALEFPGAEIKKSYSNRNLRRIAIAVPFLIAISLLPNNSRIADTLNSSAASMVPEPSLFRLNYPDVPGKDTANAIVFPISENVIRESVIRDTEETEEVKKEEIKAVEGKFSVIAGCFKIKDNAGRLHKQLIDKGYPATITTSRTGFYKVSMESFATREDAMAGLDRLKRTEPGMELWVAL